MSTQFVKCKKCGTDNLVTYDSCKNCGASLVLPVKPLPPLSEKTTESVTLKSPAEENSFTTLPIVLPSSFQGTVVFSQPKLALTDVYQSIQRWTGRQSFWPQELSVSVLSKNLEVLYLAHWFINGTGGGSWSASVGHDFKIRTECPSCSKSLFQSILFGDSQEDKFKRMTCRTCNGRGYIEEKKTNWLPSSGRLLVSLDRFLVQNIADGLRIRCGKRDTNVTMQPLMDSNIHVLKPQATNEAVGKEFGDKELLQKLQEQAREVVRRKGDHYKDLRVNIDLRDLNIQTWLYPIYVSEYSFNSETLRVQVDGITGETCADVPSSVSTKRTLLVLGIIAAIVAVIIIIVLAANAVSR